MPTRVEIENAMTPKGGYTRQQLAAWGIPWPPPKGWKKSLMISSSNQEAPSAANLNET